MAQTFHLNDIRTNCKFWYAFHTLLHPFHGPLRKYDFRLRTQNVIASNENEHLFKYTNKICWRWWKSWVCPHFLWKTLPFSGWFPFAALLENFPLCYFVWLLNVRVDIWISNLFIFCQLFYWILHWMYSIPFHSRDEERERERKKRKNERIISIPFQ